MKWWRRRLRERRAEWRLVYDVGDEWVKMEHDRCGRSFLVERLDEAEALSRSHVCPREL